MSHPIDYRILAALRTRLAGILRADGYYTDAGQFARIGRYAELEDQPLVLLLPGEATPVSVSAARIRWAWLCRAEILLPVDVEEQEAELNSLLARADLQKALFGGAGALDRQTLDDIPVKLAIVRLVAPTQREDGRTVHGAALDFTIEYHTDLGDPHA